MFECLAEAGGRRPHDLPSCPTITTWFNASFAHHNLNATIGTDPSAPPTESRDKAGSPAADDEPGTTRERPANRSGIRPLARPRERDPDVANAGGTAGGSDLSSCMDERFRDSREARTCRT